MDERYCVLPLLITTAPPGALYPARRIDMKDYCGDYLFKMYRPGHAVFKYKVIFAWDIKDAMEYADKWAEENGYVDYELVKVGD